MSELTDGSRERECMIVWLDVFGESGSDVKYSRGWGEMYGS